LVEDQSLIALDTEVMLREIGATSVDIFTTAEPARAWLSSTSPDVAVLDVNLGATLSYSIAEALRVRAIPFIFTTGYGDTAKMPDQFADIPIVAKPYTLESLRQALALCLGRDRASD
jgi:DNA-binding NtrC family response regulator